LRGRLTGRSRLPAGEARPVGGPSAREAPSPSRVPGRSATTAVAEAGLGAGCAGASTESPRWRASPPPGAVRRTGEGWSGCVVAWVHDAARQVIGEASGTSMSRPCSPAGRGLSGRWGSRRARWTRRGTRLIGRARPEGLAVGATPCATSRGAVRGRLWPRAEVPRGAPHGFRPWAAAQGAAASVSGWYLRVWGRALRRAAGPRALMAPRGVAMTPGLGAPERGREDGRGPATRLMAPGRRWRRRRRG
jgi:hypothetical protein